MIGLQINEELLEAVEGFSGEQRRDEIAELFEFRHRRLVFGEGALDTLGEECRRLGVGRVFLVRDPQIGALEAWVLQLLEKEGIGVVGTYRDVTPNPSVESVDRCARVIEKVKCDGIIALGGGSTIDTVKAAICVATVGKSVACLFGFDQISRPANWPMIAIPTTAGTGSEASWGAIVADASGKRGVFSEYLRPKLALVDPRLSRDLPSVLTAITGLDALGHALECTVSQKSNAFGDAVARESLRSGCAHIVRAIEQGHQDPEARYHMARCSLLAGLLLSPINTGAAHALGYGIEKVSFEKGKPVPHGTAVGLVLPGVMRHNLPAVADKYYYVAGVAGLDLRNRSREEGAGMAADWIEDLRRKWTPHGCLANAGLSASDIPRMVEIAMTVRRLLDPSPVPVRAKEAERIYQAVLN